MMTNTIPERGVRLLAACLLMLAACDGEMETAGTGDVAPAVGSRLSVTASVRDFTDPQTGTRATETGAELTFQNGDKMGVFALRSDGTIQERGCNVPLTFKDGAWTGDVYYYDEQTTYIAYFPYNETRYAGKTSINLAYIQANFEQDLETDYDIADPDYDKYSKMLITTSNVAGDKVTKALSLTFRRVLAMVEVTIPDKVQGYSNANGEDFYYNIRGIEADTPWRVYSFSVDGNDWNFHQIPGTRTYRRILVPGTADITITCIVDWFMTEFISFSTAGLTLAGGDYKKLTLRLRRDLQPGDCYYSDGSFFPGQGRGDPPAEGCVAVIFKMGKGEGDDIADYGGTGLKAIHGYAVALENATGQCKWGPINDVVGTSTSETDYRGYWNTTKIKSTGAVSQYPAADYAISNNGTTAPANSSGWYLGSAGQWVALGANLNSVSVTLVKVGGVDLYKDDFWDMHYYWTSSEYSGNKNVGRVVALIEDLLIGGYKGYLQRWNKDIDYDWGSPPDTGSTTMYSRSVITF